MNLLNTLVGGVAGYFTGGPAGAAVGALQGVTGANANTAIGNIGNGAIGAANMLSEADNAAMLGENLRHQSAMGWQSTWFNEMMDEKAEKMREMNSLRDLDMEQRKADNQITKKFISSVTE